MEEKSLRVLFAAISESDMKSFEKLLCPEMTREDRKLVLEKIDIMGSPSDRHNFRSALSSYEPKK